MYFGKYLKQDAATFEHITPKSKGGTFADSNIVIACHLCNVVRDRANPFRFERTVQTLLTIPHIRAAWHSFKPREIRLLRAEIEFAAIKERQNRERVSAGSVRLYNRVLAERKSFVARQL